MVVLMGKSSINGPFSMAMLVITRGYGHCQCLSSLSGLATVGLSGLLFPAFTTHSERPVTGNGRNIHKIIQHQNSISHIQHNIQIHTVLSECPQALQPDLPTE